MMQLVVSFSLSWFLLPVLPCLESPNTRLPPGKQKMHSLALLFFFPLPTQQQWLVEVRALWKKKRMETSLVESFCSFSFSFPPFSGDLWLGSDVFFCTLFFYIFLLLFIKRACVYVCVRVLCLISLTIFVFSIILVFPRLLPPGNAQCDKVVLPQIR